METKLAAAPPWERVDGLDWEALGTQLDERGFAITEPVLDEGECAELAGLFDGGRFRSTVDMARHRFGDGRYRYFDHPLPAPIGELRSTFYAHLAPIANEWAERLAEGGSAIRPATRSCSSAAPPRARNGRRR